jgi:hypothetical protein
MIRKLMPLTAQDVGEGPCPYRWPPKEPDRQESETKSGFDQANDVGIPPEDWSRSTSTMGEGESREESGVDALSETQEVQLRAQVFIDQTEGRRVEISVVLEGLSSGDARKYHLIEEAESVLLGFGF